jgi:hypothetical protein
MAKSFDVRSTCAPMTAHRLTDEASVAIKASSAELSVGDGERRHSGVPLTERSQMPFGCIRIT